MDGQTAIRAMLAALNESGISSTYLKKRVAYEKLHEAACDFARRTMSLTASVDISTVVDQQRYDLPVGFIEPFTRNYNRRFFAIFTDLDAVVTHPPLSSYEKIRYADDDAAESPTSFAITDKQTKPSLITGTTTSAGAQANGESIVVDTGAAFVGFVAAGDVIHNITAATAGLVLGVTDNTHLATAIFDTDGNPSAWSLSDEYKILSMVRKQIFLNAPSEIAALTFTLDYFCMPEPMYSDFSFWRFDPKSCAAIAKEAAALFLDSKKEYGAANILHKEFSREIRQYRMEMGRQNINDQRYIG